MIRSIIIDDEKNNIENLVGLLKRHCPEVRVAGVALNADDGAALISQMQPDLVFLDIQMPDKSGFQLLEGLTEYNFEIILVTAFDQYGIQAVKFSAIDYLLKPVNIEELKAAVDKVEKRLQAKRQNLELQNLLLLIKHQEQRSAHRLALPTNKETRFINPQDIIRCESSNAYTSFYLTDGQKIMVSKPIYEYEELLSDFGFIRCHQSHLVNKKFVKSWVKEDGGSLLLVDNSSIPVSRNKKEAVMNALHTIR
ncbi:LytTR family DNA-binding domain-containing protein [Paraflavitalea speifideaquila]|uniref:LytR/AlgR family response regulator transcription factor n=1 Tax=Paraflavitalea speifideaquila TaxID=3076558 RepID=UPI0028F0E484|nr:LytTR family DNA-binding domain-containing protein [Paraflavitalea speifideiaquila]